MREQVALVILTLPLAARAGAEVRITLVRNGAAVAGIAVAERPTRSAQFAAAELQYHIHKISGAKLPIVRGHKAVEGGRVLVIDGDRLVEREVQTGLSNWDWTQLTGGLAEGERVVTNLDREGVRAGALVDREGDGVEP